MIANPQSTLSPSSSQIALSDRVRTWTIAKFIQMTLLLGGAGLFVMSIFFPYWNITLHAPQYPKGLYIEVFVNKMEPARNVFEVDGLNHYIGMIKLTEAASIERSISVYAIPLVAALAVGSVFLKGAWSWIVRLPFILYPLIFAADLYAWLYYAGHSLDKHAPMSSSIKEFTPHILGNGTIGQFKTEAHFMSGFFISVAASLIVLVVTIWERRSRNAPA